MEMCGNVGCVEIRGKYDGKLSASLGGHLRKYSVMTVRLHNAGEMRDK